MGISTAIAGWPMERTGCSTIFGTNIEVLGRAIPHPRTLGSSRTRPTTETRQAGSIRGARQSLLAFRVGACPRSESGRRLSRASVRVFGFSLATLAPRFLAIICVKSAAFSRLCRRRYTTSRLRSISRSRSSTSRASGLHPEGCFPGTAPSRALWALVMFHLRQKLRHSDFRFAA